MVVVLNPGVAEMIITEDMAERKKRFLMDTDVIITLPGGCGTLEEISEAISLKKLSQIKMPIVIYNQDGFYDDLIALFKNFIDQRFMGDNHADLFTVIETAEELRAVLHQPKVKKDYTISDALVK